MRYQLYQFPISHYCEKVRFALDYKGLDFECHDLVPGRHRGTLTKLGGSGSVPLLVDGKQVVQGSAEIITYLDEVAPGHLLTPADANQRTEALAWEQWLDSQVGVDVRRYCYAHLLEQPDTVIGYFTAGSGWWNRLFLRLAYPKLVKLMRQRMDISAETGEQSRQRIISAVDRLEESYRDRKYLVGSRFSRADLAAAALLAPLYQPPGYGLDWGDNQPAALVATRQELHPKLQWLQRLYADHRQATNKQ